MVRALGSQLTGVGFESSKSHWWQQEKYSAQAASVSYKKPRYVTSTLEGLSATPTKKITVGLLVWV